jgi:hypothetical protein
MFQKFLLKLLNYHQHYYYYHHHHCYHNGYCKAEFVTCYVVL